MRLRLRLRVILFGAIVHFILMLTNTFWEVENSTWTSLDLPQHFGSQNCSTRFISQINLDLLQKSPEVDLDYAPLNTNMSPVAAWNEIGEKSFTFRLNEKAHLKDASSLIFHPNDNLKEICNSTYEEIIPFQNVHVEPNPMHPLRLLCTIYSIEKNSDHIQMIKNTWAQKCDGFVVGSDATIPDLNAVQVEHRGKEGYNNMWQKVQAIWVYVYQHYYSDYDWFHIGGDDLFVIVENMRAYLASTEIQCASPDGKIPLYLGLRYAIGNDMNKIYATGGPGYTLNKAALKLLVVEILPNIDFAHVEAPEEDWYIAEAFRTRSVYPYDTRDMLGSQRYHHWKPSFGWWYVPPKGSCREWWHGCTIALNNTRWGHDYVSSTAIAFHYIKPFEMKMLYAWVHGHCYEYGGPPAHTAA